VLVTRASQAAPADAHRRSHDFLPRTSAVSANNRPAPGASRSAARPWSRPDVPAAATTGRCHTRATHQRRGEGG
jgi:hypothetical protein